MSTDVETLSHRLLGASEREFNAALAMSFVQEVSAGTIEPAVFARYLALEAEFVVTAIRARGQAIALAPTTAAVTGHFEAMRSLVEGQLPALDGYKSGASPEVNISANARERAGQLGAALMDLVAEGTYAQIICGLYACEHLYRVWCTRALDGTVARNSEENRGGLLAVVYDWVRAHTKEPFKSEVEFLKNEVDNLDVTNEVEQSLLVIFRSMLLSEIEFHAAAYISC